MKGLVLKNLSFAYPDGTRALEAVSLRLEPGQAMALLGPNGSGKTTLSKLLLGLLQPGTGEILLDGEPLTALRPAQRARHLGYVFQNPDDQLFLPTVREELAFNALQLGRPREEIEKRLKTVSAQLGLGSHLDTHPFELGDNLRKLVILGAVLIADPPILVLDEPSSGLGKGQLERIRLALEDRLAAGRSLLLISHDLAWAGTLCPIWTLLCEGRIVRSTRFEEILRDPAAMQAAHLPMPFLPALAHKIPTLPLTFDREIAWEAWRHQNQ